MRAGRALTAGLLALALGAGASPGASAMSGGDGGGAPAASGRGAAGSSRPTPKTTLPAVETQAMCVTCKIPLTEAQSPQADRERAFIQRLIAAGLTEGQIKNALVREYGPTVLALPPAHGFDLAAYLVPVALVVAVLVLLALLLPRWRRRAREAPLAEEGPPTLPPADAARLEADMARFD
jgi:cytochrome c-type biogenesis protein CcmH